MPLVAAPAAYIEEQLPPPMTATQIPSEIRQTMATLRNGSLGRDLLRMAFDHSSTQMLHPRSVANAFVALFVMAEEGISVSGVSLTVDDSVLLTISRTRDTIRLEFYDDGAVVLALSETRVAPLVWEWSDDEDGVSQAINELSRLGPV